jgi:hypothetical protein
MSLYHSYKRRGLANIRRRVIAEIVEGLHPSSMICRYARGEGRACETNPLDLIGESF